MTNHVEYVIVGAGLAGAVAAETLRTEGFDGRITLIGAEPHRPYHRPPLSKDYLQGRADRDSVFVHPQDWYAEHAVDLLLETRVAAVDPHRRRVLLDDGAEQGYHKLLIATGSTPRRLTVGGSALSGVHYLRNLEDSDQLRSAFARAERAVIIGGGWIGLETAAAALAAGLAVTVLEAAELPLLRALGPEAAAIFADLHRRHGVDLRCRAQVGELIGQGGRLHGVRLADGSVIEADLVLVGVGIIADSDLAATAGLAVQDGIQVDEHLQTSDPDIYAAGDVASAYDPRRDRFLRVEHWANAERQGALAARNMLGQQAVEPRSPYFFSDQYELGMEYTGYIGPEGYQQTVIRQYEDPAERIVFWLGHGRVLAGMNLNLWDVADDIDRLVRSGITVDPADLADPARPLSSLLPAAEPVGRAG